MVYVTIHAAWMVLAVLVGTVAGYMGLVRATTPPGGKSLLPGRFLLRPHVRFGTAYYLMIYAGCVWGWAMHRFMLGGERVMPPTIGRAHLVLALGIVALYAAAGAIGAGLLGRPAGPDRRRPRLHMMLNFAGCTLVAVQIALAIYYVWIRPG